MPSAPPYKVARLKMADIARMAGVSVSSVSRALAGNPLIPMALRERIEALARQHGYVVNQAARNLRLNSTRVIGLVIPMGREADQKITDPFTLERIGHCAEEIIQRGYDVLLTKVTDLRGDWTNDLIQSHRFDGMLVFGQSTQHAALNEAAQRYMPMVVWGERLPEQAYVSVGVDNRLGGRLATRHLIETGRRAIHFMGPIYAPEIASRYQGYLDAMAEAGLTPHDPVDSGFTIAPAQAAARAFLATRPDIDALFAASDIMAYGAMTVLQEMGLRVPDDCAVCGFDDVSLAQTVSPPLTSVRQDMTIGARHLVDLLFRRMAGEAGENVVFPAQLVVRASTGTAQSERKKLSMDSHEAPAEASQTVRVRHHDLLS